MSAVLLRSIFIERIVCTIYLKIDITNFHENWGYQNDNCTLSINTDEKTPFEILKWLTHTWKILNTYFPWCVLVVWKSGVAFVYRRLLHAMCEYHGGASRQLVQFVTSPGVQLFPKHTVVQCTRLRQPCPEIRDRYALLQPERCQCRANRARGCPVIHESNVVAVCGSGAGCRPHILPIAFFWDLAVVCRVCIHVENVLVGQQNKIGRSDGWICEVASDEQRASRDAPAAVRVCETGGAWVSVCVCARERACECVYVWVCGGKNGSEPFIRDPTWAPVRTTCAGGGWGGVRGGGGGAPKCHLETKRHVGWVRHAIVGRERILRWEGWLPNQWLEGVCLRKVLGEVSASFSPPPIFTIVPVWSNAVHVGNAWYILPLFQRRTITGTEAIRCRVAGLVNCRTHCTNHCFAAVPVGPIVCKNTVIPEDRREARDVIWAAERTKTKTATSLVCVLDEVEAPVRKLRIHWVEPLLSGRLLQVNPVPPFLPATNLANNGVDCGSSRGTEHRAFRCKCRFAYGWLQCVHPNFKSHFVDLIDERLQTFAASRAWPLVNIRLHPSVGIDTWFQGIRRCASWARIVIVCIRPATVDDQHVVAIWQKEPCHVLRNSQRRAFIQTLLVRVPAVPPTNWNHWWDITAANCGERITIIWLLWDVLRLRWNHSAGKRN